MQSKHQDFKMFEGLFQPYRIIPESLHLCIPLNLWWEVVNYFWFLGNLADAAFYVSSFTLQLCWNQQRKTFLLIESCDFFFLSILTIIIPIDLLIIS